MAARGDTKFLFSCWKVFPSGHVLFCVVLKTPMKYQTISKGAVYYNCYHNNGELFTCRDMFSRESSPGISLVFIKWRVLYNYRIFPYHCAPYWLTDWLTDRPMDGRTLPLKRIFNTILNYSWPILSWTTNLSKSSLHCSFRPCLILYMSHLLILSLKFYLTLCPP